MRSHLDPCIPAARRTTRTARWWLGAFLLASTVSGPATVGTARGAGLVGEHHLAVMVGGDAADDSFEPWRFHVRYNRPLNASLDLTLETVRESDIGFDGLLPPGVPSLDLSTKKEVVAGVTWHQRTSAGRVFVNAAVGFARADFGNNQDAGTSYAFAAGIELAAGRWIAVAPFVGWKDVASITNANDERLDFGAARIGVRTSFHAGESWAFVADGVVDDNSRWTFTGGLAYRF